MGQSSLEVFYLFKKLFDEFLTIAFQCDRDDVLEVIYLVMRKLTLRKGSNSLLQLLQKAQERIGEGVKPE